MEETPSEREQRLAKMKTEMELDKVLKKGQRQALKEQPARVQKLVYLRDWAKRQSEAVAAVGSAIETEGWLLATTEAWEAAIAAMEKLSAELGTEIASEWVWRV